MGNGKVSRMYEHTILCGEMVVFKDAPVNKRGGIVYEWERLHSPLALGLIFPELANTVNRCYSFLGMR